MDINSEKIKFLYCDNNFINIINKIAKPFIYRQFIKLFPSNFVYLYTLHNFVYFYFLHNFTNFI